MVRFDKPCRNLRGAVGYFREHLGIGDYLGEGGRVPMRWFGKGAERLGLSGACSLEDFDRLCRGKHPSTAESLLVRDKGAQRRVCFFGQVSAPKDVSILHLVGGDERIAGWWREAVELTLAEIEGAIATRVRRDRACADRVTGEMVSAVVTHDASRALDPQLHTHVCIMNLTFDAVESRWKGVQPAALYRDQSFFREVCHQHLAARMKAVGYTLTNFRPGGFDVLGVPSHLREIFSKRRNAILAEAQAEGKRDQDSLQAIASRSRAAKREVESGILRERWQQEAGEDLAALRAAVATADGRHRTTEGLAAADSLASAGRHAFERRSVVRRSELLRDSLSVSRGEASLAELKEQLRLSLERGDVIAVDEKVGSKAALAAEREFVTWAHAQRSAFSALGTAADSAELSVEQRDAAARVLASRSAVTVLQGDAGTGKTTCLRAIVAGIERSGRQVFACAPSAGATEVLRQEVSEAADTLQQWLVNEPLREETRGRVIVVDEAGLISVPQMLELCRRAAQHRNRVLLVGDAKQHHAVEAGDALRCLQRYARVPTASLREIRRQVHPGYRAAVAALARGSVQDAFRRFEELGAVRELPVPGELFRAAAVDYATQVQAGRSVLAVSPVWREIGVFTQEVRQEMKGRTLLGVTDRTLVALESRRWTREERRRIANYRPGDVLSFHLASAGIAKGEQLRVQAIEGHWLRTSNREGGTRWVQPDRTAGFDVLEERTIVVARGERLLIRGNCRPAGLRNGDLVTVAEIGEGDEIVLADGRSIPPAFRQFAHGYATTSHAAQGKTVAHGILLLGPEGLKSADLKQCYVSNSRFRESQVIFTTSARAAREAMARPGDRELVTEMIGDRAFAYEAQRLSITPGRQ